MSSSTKTQKLKFVKVFVGSISPALAKDPLDLQTRLSRFGKVIKPLDLHHKPVPDLYFGYITLQLSEIGYRKLKKNFHGIKYKGSTLVIDKAQPDYLSRWSKDAKREDTKIALRRQQEIRAKVRDQRIAHKDDPRYGNDVIKGRLREVKKEDLRKLQIRVNISGVVKVIKCRKTKLWGYDKNKKIRDLVYRFVDGEWRDGNNHVIDKLTKKYLTFHSNGSVQITDKIGGSSEQDPDADSDAGLDTEQMKLEKERNNKLLESLLSKYNFDKPVDVEQDNDQYGGADYEYEGIYNSNSDNEESESEDIFYNNANINKECIKPTPNDIIEEYRQNQALTIAKEQTPHGNEDEDEESDEEFYKNLYKKNDQSEENYNENSKPEENMEEDAAAPDSDDEFIPTFESKLHTQPGQNQESSESDEEFMPTFGSSAPAATSTTEALRSLFNPVEAETEHFSLSTGLVDEDDIDEEKAKESEMIDSIQESHIGGNIDLSINTNDKLGLFFAHLDSPFLVAQTQLNKLPKIFDFKEQFDHEKWFWENRGELNREFRKLKRDSVRQSKKKVKSILI